MDRIQSLRELLKDKKLDALYLTKRTNVNYISAFTDEAARVLITEKNCYLITDGRFTELAEKVCKGFQIVNWHNFERSIPKTLFNLCEQEHIKKLGFEENEVSYEEYVMLNNALNAMETILLPSAGLVESLRYVKEQEEVNDIMTACQIADKALNELLPYIKPGVTERELCARLEYSMKMNGAHGIGFETILISGAKTSLPHGKPDDKEISYGDFVTVDFGVLYNEYTSDMTRTFVVGKADEKQLEVYNLVREIQQIGLDSLKDGVSAKHPDDEIRKHLGSYEPYYYAGIGHGVGRDLYEEPFLGNYGTRTLKSGNILTMEPGIYIPGFGGVRIEDVARITAAGADILTQFSKELIVV